MATDASLSPTPEAAPQHTPGATEERAAAMVSQAIPGYVIVPDARRILDSVRAFAREQDAIKADMLAALEEIKTVRTDVYASGADMANRMAAIAQAVIARARGGQR